MPNLKVPILDIKKSREVINKVLETIPSEEVEKLISDELINNFVNQDSDKDLEDIGKECLDGLNEKG